MGEAYLELMQDPEMLQVQLHGFAAAPADPDIARSCRRTFEVLADVFYDRTHGTEDELREFFAMGMLINVMSAIDLLSVPERWAQSLCPTARESRQPSDRQPGPGRPPSADQAANQEVPA